MRPLICAAVALLSGVVLAQPPPRPSVPQFEFVTFHRADVEGYRLFRRGTLVADIEVGGTFDMDLGPDNWEFFAEAYVGEEKSAQYVVHVNVTVDSTATLDCSRPITDLQPPLCRFVLTPK